MGKAIKTTTRSADAPSSTSIALIAQGMRNAIAAADTTEEARALPIFDDVPVGHMLFQVEGERHEPHLHDGEWVVVDTSDREIVFGELYLVLQSQGPALWQITLHRDRHGRIDAKPWHGGAPFVWMCPLSKPRTLPNGKTDLSGPIHLSDGPISAELLQRDILGRVVGIIDPRERADRQRRAAELRKAGAERAARERRMPPQIEGGAP